MFFFLVISLFISILLESTVTTLPLAFLLLLCYSVLNRSGKVFLSAFVIGILLDIFMGRILGETSIYFLLFFALLLLYQRKYEIRSYFFITLSSFVGSYFYLLFLSGNASIARSLICTIFAICIFGVGKQLKLYQQREDV